MLNRFLATTFGFSLALLTACGSNAPPGDSPASQQVDTTQAAANANHLRMTIDGVEWIADNGVWGAVDALGATGTVLIAGNLGHGKAQQAFNLNLDGITGPGRYRVAAAGTPDHGIAQIANLSAARYIAGGAVFDHDMQVDLLQVQAHPVRIEARFSGVLHASDGSPLRIEGGQLRYAE